MKRGDIYLVSLDPTAGHEQRGSRPVVIVSPPRVLDLAVRQARWIDSVPDAIMDDVLARLSTLFE